METAVLQRLRIAVLCVALTSLCGCASEKASQPTPAEWSTRMTNSVMKFNPDFWSIDFSTKPKWSYTYGLMCKSMLAVYDKTQDPAILAYVERYYDTLINDKGEIATYKQSDYNIDQINSGKALITLYKLTGKEKYKLAIQTLRDQMKVHPRTSVGGFWHKKIYENQMWLDGIYMGSPFLAQYAVAFNEPALFDDIANQIILMEKHARDARTGLLYHGWDESRKQKWANPDTGVSPCFWGRAMGWYGMAIVDVLDEMPKDHPKRAEIIVILNRMVKALAAVQDTKTGLWYQVLDQGTQPGNYLEASASCMFVYTMAKAARLGYIDSHYTEVARKGYQGILTTLITTAPDGKILLHQCCAVAGLGGTPYRDGSYDYYIKEPIRDNDPKAIGPFILAGLELE